MKLQGRGMKTALSCLLVLVMVFGLAGAAPAFAEGNKTLNYVSLGDSTTNGYGFADYYPAAGGNIRGYLMQASEAYPTLVAQALESEYGYNVNLTQLAVSGMRVEELRALLDAGYAGDDYTKRVFTDPNGENWFGKCPGGEAGVRGTFVSAITDANLITFNLGVNNFGTYFTERLTAMLGMGGSSDDDSLADLALTPALSAQTKQIKTNVADKLSELTDGKSETVQMVNDLAGVLAYCYAGFVINFDADMDLIYKLNPDAQIIVMGLPNMLEGVKLEYNGLTIDLGSLFGSIIDMANLHMSAENSHCTAYTYTNATQYNRFIDELAADQVSATLEKWIRDIMQSCGISDSRYADVKDTYVKAARTNPLSVTDALANMGVLGSGINSTEILDKAMNSTTLNSSLNVYARFMLAAGLGVHPDAAGYKAIAAKVLAAYKDGVNGPEYLAKSVVETVVDSGRSVADKIAQSLGNIGSPSSSGSRLNNLVSGLRSLFHF